MKNKRRFIDGRCLKEYHCQDCKKQISYNSALYGLKRCKSCAMKKLFKNPKNHPKYKDGRTNKKYYCIDCNKEISMNSGYYGEKRCISCFQIGKNNNNYINGMAYEPYSKQFNDKLKEYIRKRDNYTCQLCDKKGKDIHHIDYNKKNCNENNLITLCHKCNIKVNKNRIYWKKELRKEIIKKLQ